MGRSAGGRARDSGVDGERVMRVGFGRWSKRRFSVGVRGLRASEVDGEMKFVVSIGRLN